LTSARSEEIISAVLEPPRVYSDHLNYPAPSGSWGLKYYYAQYALCPLILVRSVCPDIFVGDFVEATSSARLEKSGLFIVVKDFGNGTLILRKRG
jgi:hypothetical protein